MKNKAVKFLSLFLILTLFVNQYHVASGANCHEAAHALSIKHPTTPVGSIMQSGANKFTSLYTYDKDALKGKWYK